MKGYAQIIPTSTYIPESLKIEKILGDPKYVRLIDNFAFYSAILKRACCIPKGTIIDLESVPFIRGTNPEAGAIHDYLSMIDSIPVVSKKIAADVYFEMQEYMDSLEKDKNKVKHYFNRAWDFLRRHGKTGVVRVWPGYYHKRKIKSSYEEITGCSNES